MSNIFKRIPAIMSELGAISKDGINKHQNYNFRGIEQMYNSINPLLVKHGVFVVPQIVDKTFENYPKAEKLSFRVLLTVNHKFYADDGSFVEVITQGEGIDTSDKASNKAMSAAMKYAFIELFSIPTADIEDSDRDHTEVTTPIKTSAAGPVIKAVSAKKVEAATEQAPPMWTTEELSNQEDVYVIPFGKKFKGKTLHECNIDELQSYAAWLQDSAAKEGKPLSKQGVEFLNQLAIHLTHV